MSDLNPQRKPRASLTALLKRLRTRATRPRGLLVRAALLAGAYLALHAVGLRAYTTVFSGTSPTGAPIDLLDVTLGVVYALAYLGFVVVVPILILASVVQLLVFLARERWGALPDQRPARTRS